MPRKRGTDQAVAQAVGHQVQRLLSCREAGEATGLSERWWRRQVEMRAVDTVKLGGPKAPVRIPESEVVRVLAENYRPRVGVA